MTDFRELLPADVRERIEEREAQGLTLEEQGQIRDITPVRPPAPHVKPDELDGLFGVTEDPQSGKVYYLQPPRERGDE